jgi:hypothetical protein
MDPCWAMSSVAKAKPTTSAKYFPRSRISIRRAIWFMGKGKARGTKAEGQRRESIVRSQK